MKTLDWFVLVSSLTFIVVYGIWKSRGSNNVKGYLLSNNDMKWYTIALSIMATQASAITFLSTPGQAYVDGMRFVQFYLGLPIAMVIISITAVPIFHKLKIYTAYELLEKKFDLKTRALAALLFLIQRGLAAGLTIYAPSIILSVLLGWNLYWTNLIIGVIVILYTTLGGAKAVGWTQFHQMIVIFFGMLSAFVVMIILLPDNVTFIDSLRAAGKLGKLNVIDFSFDLNNRYSFWSGIIGGLFLQLSYFGTDQSQVQRYLTGESVAQSRIGLLVNGLVKIPMQFLILFIGAMLFVFYQFTAPPIFFNPVEVSKLQTSNYAGKYKEIENTYYKTFDEKKQHLNELLNGIDNNDFLLIKSAENKLNKSSKKIAELKSATINLMKENDPDSNTNDTNYIFLTFVLSFLPAGLIGLVLAAILSASMSSTSSEINALASTTMIDIYKRLIKKDATEKHYVVFTKFATVAWGLLAVMFAEFANQLGSLIEAVNILGSLFYGTILGIFLLAFYSNNLKGKSVFISAIIAEFLVLFCYFFTGISFLWYNLVGCLAVILIALLLNKFFEK